MEIVLENGGWFALWAKVESFITPEKLKQWGAMKYNGLTKNEVIHEVRMGAPQIGAAIQPVKAASGLDQTRYHNIRGGLRVPHIHYKNEIYLLDKKQWQEFCKPLLKEFQEKLSKASSVSFQQLLEISEALEGLG